MICRLLLVAFGLLISSCAGMRTSVQDSPDLSHSRNFDAALAAATKNGFKSVLGCGGDSCSILLIDPLFIQEEQELPVEFYQRDGSFRFKLVNFSEFYAKDGCSKECVISNEVGYLFFNAYRGIIVLYTNQNPLCFEVANDDRWCHSNNDQRGNYMIVLVSRNVR